MANWMATRLRERAARLDGEDAGVMRDAAEIMEAYDRDWARLEDCDALIGELRQLADDIDCGVVKRDEATVDIPHRAAHQIKALHNRLAAEPIGIAGDSRSDEGENSV